MRRLSVLKDGTYRAWYSTPLGQGTGIAHVADGKVWGCDSIMTYSGSCQVDGDRFTAVVCTKRYVAGHATVFGVDDLELTIEGTCVGRIATYAATAEQAPGIVLAGTLIRSEDAIRESTPPVPVFDPSGLPKLPPLRR